MPSEERQFWHIVIMFLHLGLLSEPFTLLTCMRRPKSWCVGKTRLRANCDAHKVCLWISVVVVGRDESRKCRLKNADSGMCDYVLAFGTSV